MLGSSGAQRGIGLGCQFLSDLGGKRRAGLGRAGAEAQRSHDAPFRQGGPQLVVPFMLAALDAIVEPFPDLVGQIPGLCVAGEVFGSYQHGAKVAQVDPFDAGDSGVGAVAPLGDLHWPDQ